MKKFNITWTPGDDGGAAITGHDVGYTPSGGSETVVATGSTAAVYTLSGLTDDVEYSVRVRAENSAGKGAWSDAVVQVAALPPAQTTGLAVDSTGDGTIDLSWSAPASDAAITDYRVEYTPSGGSATEVLVGSAATSYQLTGLTNDTEYSVRVAAISAGGQGDYSAAVTGTPVAALFSFTDPTPSFSGTFTTSAYTNGPTHGRGSSAFAGGILAPNGKVILMPWNHNIIGIYDPVANTYTNGPTARYVFAGGVLEPSGKVILVPHESTNIGIYDPVANTYADGPAHGRGGSAFWGGVLAPDGKVILVPRNSDNIGIYDPVANTYTNGPAHGRGNFAFYGGVLTPNGKVILVPYVSSNIGIYDPVANTYTDGPAHGLGGDAFWGGVLAPNGKVILVPFYRDIIGIYDPVANTYTNGPSTGHGTQSGAFAGGVLAPNGKVILVPYDRPNVGIYDPVANTYTDGPADVLGNESFMGGVLAPNGKVILVPYKSANVGIVTPDPLLTVSDSVAMSPYLNKL